MDNFTSMDIDGKAPMFYLIILINKTPPSLTTVIQSVEIEPFLNKCVLNLSHRHLNLKGCKEITQITTFTSLGALPMLVFLPRCFV